MRRGPLLLLGVLAVTGPLAPPAAAPAVAAPVTAPAPTTPAAAYPWGCSYVDHGPRPSVAPLGPPAKPGLLTIGGDELAGAGRAVPDGVAPVPDRVVAASWIVADLDTGEVLGAQGAHRRHVPASIIKVLLAATILPKVRPSERVEITCEDEFGWGSEWDSDPVRLSLPLGGTYTADDLFHALLLVSSNDAANALARVAGRERGTAGTLEDMNALAHRLGAWDTHAATPSGLDPYQLPPGLDTQYQVTSAYDMALIFREAMKYEDFSRYIGAESYVIPPQPQLGRGATTISGRSTNWPTSPGLIYEFPDAIGGKSGYTALAGHTYVGARERDGRRLVAVVLGVPVNVPADNRAYQQVAALIEWGFGLPEGSTVGRLVEPGEVRAQYEAKAPPPARPVVVVAPGPGSPVGAAFLLAGGAAAAAVLGAGVAVGLVRRRGRRRAAPTAGAARGVARVAPANLASPEPASPQPAAAQAAAAQPGAAQAASAQVASPEPAADGAGTAPARADPAAGPYSSPVSFMGQPPPPPEHGS